MEILQQFAASLTSPTVPVVHAMQYDAGRQLRLRLYSGATEWPVPDGVTAGVCYTLPDRSKGYFEQLSDGSAACTIEGNAVTAVVAPVMTSTAGTVKAAIVLRNGDAQISTFPFQIRVTPRPGSVTKPEAQPDAVSVFAGKLFYGAESGMAAPLGVGDGLEVRDGVLRALADPNAATTVYVDEVAAQLRDEWQGGVTSWEALEDRPFYDENYSSEHSFVDDAEPVTFDAAVMGYRYWKISDLQPTRDQIPGMVFRIGVVGGGSMTETAEAATILVETDDGVVFQLAESSLAFALCRKTGEIAFSFSGVDVTVEVPETGIYMAYAMDGKPGDEIAAIGVEYRELMVLDLKFLPMEAIEALIDAKLAEIPDVSEVGM